MAAGIFTTDFREEVFAFLEVKGQLQFGNGNHLRSNRSQGYFNPTLVMIKSSHVGKSVGIKFRSDHGIDDGQHVFVERGREPGCIVVRRFHASHVRDELRPKEYTIPRIHFVMD